MKFVSGINTLEFGRGGNYSAPRPVEIVQAKERSASGIPHVESFGVLLQSRTINFDSIPLEEYVELLNWFVNVANGQENNFYFFDERNDMFVVSFSASTLNLPETSYRRFSGAVVLEIEA